MTSNFHKVIAFNPRHRFERPGVSELDSVNEDEIDQQSTRPDSTAEGSAPTLTPEWPQISGVQSECSGLAASQRLPGWEQGAQKFPLSHNISLRNLRRLIKFSGYERGREALFQEFPRPPSETDRLTLYLLLLEELRDFAAVDELIKDTVDLLECTLKQYMSLIRIYLRRGDLKSADKILVHSVAKFPNNSWLQDTRRRVRRQLRTFEAVFPGGKLPDGRLSVVVLEHLLCLANSQRSSSLATPESVISRVILVGGSLGIGGAERQFVATATALNDAIHKGNAVGGVVLHGPVEVICRSLRTRGGGRFFLSQLENSDILVDEYEDFQDYGGNSRFSALAKINRLLALLPTDIAEATRKLTDVFRAREPTVVHIWQDGAILTSFPAALLAGVPKIVLSVRTLPSVDRVDRFRPEYESLYRIALSSAGVKIVANSIAVAQRYAEWLETDPRNIGVIYNGVARLHDAATPSAVLMAEQAGVYRGCGCFVVGTVMRFDRNKRPLLWVEAALSLLDQHAAAKFILVGEGPLWEPTKEFVRRSGKADSFCFVGRSDEVGFWLSLMSVFVLLSEFESLPNALIEAQMAGVPIVTTPAGGAAEAFLDGETGTLLAAKDKDNMPAIVEAVLRWNLTPDAVAIVAMKLSPMRGRNFLSTLWFMKRSWLTHCSLHGSQSLSSDARRKLT